MTDDATPLLEAIRLEKQLLEPLSFAAGLRIDTTHTTPHELRQQVAGFARGEATPGMTLLFESFGFKHGTPLDADYVFDVRCLPNPYWQPELRPYTGLDAPVIEFMQRYDEVEAMFDEIRGFLERWLPRFEREDRSYLTVAVGCTGGLHRSVYLVRRLADRFADQGVKTQGAPPGDKNDRRRRARGEGAWPRDCSTPRCAPSATNRRGCWRLRWIAPRHPRPTDNIQRALKDADYWPCGVLILADLYGATPHQPRLPAAGARTHPSSSPA